MIHGRDADDNGATFFLDAAKSINRIKLLPENDSSPNMEQWNEEHIPAPGVIQGKNNGTHISRVESPADYGVY